MRETVTPRPRTTIADVARSAGTSTASVSYYLNGKLEKLGSDTQRRIAEVIRETGYVPNAQAQKLQGKQTHVIAILILDNTNEWAGTFLAGVEQVAHTHGYATMVCTSNFDTETELMYVEKMLSLGVDGFIVQPTRNFRVVSERISKTGTPLVLFDFAPYSRTYTCVKTNLYDGVYNATERLLEAGYEEFLTIASDMTRMRTRTERFQGFADALAAQGIFHKAISIDHASPTERELREYFKFKLNPAKRTAIFVQNQWALGRVFKALQPMAHLIPEKIGLLGLNCTGWTNLTSPTVSTIVEPVHREGETACEMLIELLDGYDGPVRQEALDCCLNWLESTSIAVG